MTGWESFLNCIQFPSQGRRIQDVWALVEPDFGNRGFGHPDFLARVNFEEGGGSAILLLEAKLRDYVHSSHFVRNRKGFNSSINGQLELNYRLAQALSDYKKGATLLEPAWITSEFIEYLPRRYLKSSLVLERVVEALCGLPINCYYHVMITSDTQDPRNAIPRERQPRIFTSDRRDDWDSFKRQLFWTNWQALYALANAWAVRSFSMNYDFMRCRDRIQSSSGRVPEQRASRGVSLVRFSPSALVTAKRTYLHLSWKKPGSVRLSDFSGPVPQPVRVPFKSIDDLFACIEHEWPLSVKPARTNDPWWHAKTIEANRSAWPNDDR